MAIENNELFCKMIVLDTTSYAGNFERELCAYVTGQLADCNVGKELIETDEEITHLEWWEDNICPQEDTEGSEFFRPCTVWKTEGINNYGEKVEEGANPHPFAFFSVAIFVEEFPPQEVLDEMLKRAKDFCEDPIKIYKNNGLYISINFPKNLGLTGCRLIEPNIEKVLVEVDKITSLNIKKIKI